MDAKEAKLIHHPDNERIAEAAEELQRRQELEEMRPTDNNLMALANMSGVLGYRRSKHWGSRNHNKKPRKKRS